MAEHPAPHTQWYGLHTGSREPLILTFLPRPWSTEYDVCPQRHSLCPATPLAPKGLCLLHLLHLALSLASPPLFMWSFWLQVESPSPTHISKQPLLLYKKQALALLGCQTRASIPSIPWERINKGLVYHCTETPQVQIPALGTLWQRTHHCTWWAWVSVHWTTWAWEPDGRDCRGWGMRRRCWLKGSPIRLPDLLPGPSSAFFPGKA